MTILAGRARGPNGSTPLNKLRNAGGGGVRRFLVVSTSVVSTHECNGCDLEERSERVVLRDKRGEEPYGHVPAPAKKH